MLGRKQYLKQDNTESPKQHSVGANRQQWCYLYCVGESDASQSCVDDEAQSNRVATLEWRNVRYRQFLISFLLVEAGVNSSPTFCSFFLSGLFVIARHFEKSLSSREVVGIHY